jgi:DNA-binding XRE family transcriptional regulator
MRQRIKLPRIIKIEEISGHKIQCMFNNGESRILDFEKIFNEWKITEQDIEFKLLDPKEFKKVQLRNYTLSWPNIGLKIKNENGETEKHPYEVGPDVLFKLSNPVEKNELNKFGNLIRTARLKAGLTQEQLAMRSGTTRFYISRIENNKTDVEMSTFRKIIEAGLGKNLKMTIE